MKTHRLRPKWTLGTMLLVVGWSSVVVWLNIRPRYSHRIEGERMGSGVLVRKGGDIVFDDVNYGYPWVSVSERRIKSDPTNFVQAALDNYDYGRKLRIDNAFLAPFPMIGNIAIGFLAVTVLTFASKYFIRAILAALRAFMSKPPPDNLNGD